MYKGEPSKGVDFYNLLYNKDEFTSELGKVILAAGKLEAEIILFFKRQGITENIDELTLGSLITTGQRNNLLDNNLVGILRQISKQRNYFTHNIYSLFIERIDVTMLTRENLIDTDIITYTDYAYELNENLNSLADIFHKK